MIICSNDFYKFVDSHKYFEFYEYFNFHSNIIAIKPRLSNLYQNEHCCFVDRVF